MCMLYIVRPTTGRDRTQMSRRDHVPLSLEWGSFEEGGPALSLHGCDMVREWDRPSGWKLPKKDRSRLHADFTTIFRQFPGELEITAAWATDPVDEELELDRSEFLQRIMTNRLANRTRYTVRPQPQAGDIPER